MQLPLAPIDENELIVDDSSTGRLSASVPISLLVLLCFLISSLFSAWSPAVVLEFSRPETFGTKCDLLALKQPSIGDF